MKKVWIFIQNAYSYAGTENVCNFMTKAMSDSAEITVVSLEGSGVPFYDFDNAKEIISLASYKEPLKKAIDLINKGLPDVVFVVSMGRLSVLFAYRAWLGLSKSAKNNIKFISCEHIAMDSYPKLIRFLKFITLKFYHKVIVLTEHDKNLVNSWGIECQVIYNSITYKYFKRNSNNYTALAIGRLDPQKGFDLLLPIWRDFIKLNPQWKLLIAGEGKEKSNLVSLANSLGVSESVQFLGVVKNVDEYFKKSDIFLMTSRYEGLPLVLLEAKSWSLPSIAYDCPTGPRDIIANDKDGFVISIGDEKNYISKLHQLANDDVLRDKLSKQTEITAKKFDVKLIIQQWRQLI